MADISKVKLKASGTEYNIKDASAFRTGDTADTTIDTADTIPFYDTSATAKKKITVGNLAAAIGGRITKTITVYSAANDTLSFNDAMGSKTVTTNANGEGTVSITYISGMVITFTSSVAKNPDNLSTDYKKSIQLLEDTTAVYVMPNENTLYWYGYKNNLQSLTSANGWNIQQSITLVEPTYNTNYIALNSENGKGKGVATQNAITGKKLKAIYDGITIAGTSYAYCTQYNSKTSGQNSSTALSNSGMNVGEHNITKSSQYVSFHTDNGRNTNLYALWYDDNNDDLLNDKVDKTDVAPIENGSTASRPYTIGQQFYYNGSLYKAITSIAQGATFTIGTNCVASDMITDQINLKIITDEVNFASISLDGNWRSAEVNYGVTFKSNPMISIYRSDTATETAVLPFVINPSTTGCKLYLHKTVTVSSSYKVKIQVIGWL